VLVRAWSADGRSARETATLTVLNPTPPEVVAQTLSEGQTVAGIVQWRATVRGGVALVEFVVDGVVSGSTSHAPYQWSWDTTQESPGPHTVAVRAIGADGRSVDSTRTVVVAPR
jgi:hypothetical protein